MQARGARGLASRGSDRVDDFLRGEAAGRLIGQIDVTPRGGHGSLGRRGTRNDSIRTLARLPFELDLQRSEPPRVYKQIAAEAASMRAQGMRLSVISRHFGVHPHTVKKALRWSRERRVR